MEAQPRGQRLVIPSTQCPTRASADVIVDVVQNYGWWLRARGKPHLRVVHWPELLECLSGQLCGQPILALAASWEAAPQSLLHSATACALVSALHRCHDDYNDVWRDLWSQRCEGGSNSTTITKRPRVSSPCNGANCGSRVRTAIHFLPPATGITLRNRQ